MAKWLDNYNESKVTLPEGFVGMGNNIQGRHYSPAWGGQFAMGGSIPGAVGFTYARTQDPAPSNGPYAKKTKASAENGMSFYQHGLDWKPKSISKNGSVIKDDRGQWAHPGEITEIGSNQITMKGVDYPVLGVSDTGDTKMMQPGKDYKFKGKKVTEYPMAQDGDWLKKYATEPMRQDATRNVVPRKMTDKEKLEAVAKSDQAQKRALKTAKEELAERKKNKSTKGDLNTPGSWHVADKLRLFPNSPGGPGAVFDEYFNIPHYVGSIADQLGEGVANRDAGQVAKAIGESAIAGAMGLDPLGSAIKSTRKIIKPSFKDAQAAFNFIDNQVNALGEEIVVNKLIKKTGKSKEQIEKEFYEALGNQGRFDPKDPEYFIRHANMLNDKTNLPKFPKSLKELDEAAGKLVSSPNKVDFDKTEIINRANEILEKGVGIKKKNIPIKLESKDDYNVFVNVGESDVTNPYSYSGYMRLQPNFSGIDSGRPTFTEWLQGKKPEPKFMSGWGDIVETDPAFTKISDFPYDKRPDLKGTGVGAEAAEAIKQALEEKGVKLVSSTNHTEEGRLRYLTEYLNDRKKAINTEYSPRWLNAVNNIKENLKGKKVSKSEVKELMKLNPEIDPRLIQFQYKGGGWLNKYK